MSNKMDMYYAIMSTLKRFETAWQGIPKFEQHVQKLEVNIAGIESLLSEIESSKKLAAESKRRVEKQLITKVHALVIVAKSYARSVNDAELVSQFSVTKTTLSEGSMTERMNRVTRLVSQITALENELNDYGVDTNLLIELISKRDEFMQLLRSPREQIVKRKEMHQTIREMMKNIDIIIREYILAMIVLMRNDHPQFAKQFENALVIVDRRNKRITNSDAEGEIPTDGDSSPFDSD